MSVVGRCHVSFGGWSELGADWAQMRHGLFLEASLNVQCGLLFVNQEVHLVLKHGLLHDDPRNLIHALKLLFKITVLNTASSRPYVMTETHAIHDMCVCVYITTSCFN